MHTEEKIIREIYLNPGINKNQLKSNLKIGMPSIYHALKKIQIQEKKTKSQTEHYLDYEYRQLPSILKNIETERVSKRIKR